MTPKLLRDEYFEQRELLERVDSSSMTCRHIVKVFVGKSPGGGPNFRICGRPAVRFFLSDVNSVVQLCQEHVRTPLPDDWAAAEITKQEAEVFLVQES